MVKYLGLYEKIGILCVMKILIVRTFASIISSTSYNVQEIGLAKAYVRAGHQADVVLYGGKEADHKIEIPVDGTDEEKYVSVYYLKSYGIYKNGFFPSLKKLAMQYDLIQVHEYDQISSWLYYTSRRFKKKVVIYHGLYYSDFNHGYNLKCKVFDNTFLRLKKNPDCLCFGKSRGAAEFLLSKGFKKAIPVGVGLDVSAWQKAIQEGTVPESGGAIAKLPCKEAGGKRWFDYLYIGKLEPRRNTLFLLDLVDRLLKSHEDMRFILLGDGEEAYKAQCLEKARDWIEKGRIIYIEKCTQAEMPAIYGYADCMLFPSIYEIFGMVLMEAMYFNLPVITSDNGGADTVYRDNENAIVVLNRKKAACLMNGIDINADGQGYKNWAAGPEDFDIEAWVAAAEKMYSDAEFRDRIKANLEIDKEKLSWDYVAARFLDGFRENGYIEE